MQHMAPDVGTGSLGRHLVVGSYLCEVFFNLEYHMKADSDPESRWDCGLLTGSL